MSYLEEEFKKVFKKCGYGDVDVRITRISMSSGYSIKTEASFMVKITSTDAPATVENPYKIVRRKKLDE